MSIEYIQAANQYIQEGKLEEAIAVYQQVIAIQPENLDAYLNLGDLLSKLEKYEEAKAIYQQVIALHPERVEAYLNLGHLLSKLGKYEEAKAVYQQVIALQPERVEAYLNLGHLLSYGEKSEEAIAAYKGAIAVQPDKIEAYLSLAHLLSQIGLFEEAIATWKQAIARQPDLAASLGERMKTEGHPEIAIAFYQQAIAVAPENVDACMGVGEILNLQGNMEEELSWYLKAGAKQPDLGLNLGSLLQAQGKQEAAIAIYQQVIALQPENIEAYLSRAHLLSQIGFFEEAIATWKQAIARQPDLAASLGERMKTEGHPEIALAFYQQAITVAPENIEAYAGWGQVLKQQGNQEALQSWYQQTAQLKAELGLKLAYKLQALENLDAAIAVYKQVIVAAPDKVEAYLSLGHLESQIGNFDKAVVTWQQAIARQPEVGFSLAYRLQLEQKLEEACACYQQIIAVAPEEMGAYMKLAAVLNQRGKLNDAIAVWQQAIVRRPDVACDIGDKLKAQGNSEVAISLYQYAIAIQPELVELHLKLGRIFLNQPNFDAAMQSCQQALAIEPSSAEAQVLLGDILRLQGDSERGFSCYQQALKNDPNCASAYTEISKIMLLRGRKNEAFSNLYKSNQIKTAALIANGEIPCIFLNTLPKSGSQYVLEALSNGLNKPWMRIAAGGEIIRRDDIKLLADKMKLAHEHLPVSVMNLCLITEALDRLIVHVRDPRQAMLSWVHHLRKTIAETEDVLSLMHIIPDAENYFSLSLTEQISWQIEKGHLSAVINFLEGWLDAEADNSFYPKILFTKYEDLADNSQVFFESILNFYEIKKARFTFPEPPQEGKLHYRKGRKDEWREVFTPEQAQKASSMIPKGIFERFGWSPS
ncbi:tetratricopeptide repeat protein [Microcoleus sp. ARI1-B5]|uniref:tetratricopeptide repeat protein n=1 Tax=unclassified Microcoleus TaxID=2642155 RepID=UPI002FD1AE67